jgi:hypothetical protein
MNVTRVDTAYLQRIIDDLQQDHNTLFNSLKGTTLEKDKEKMKSKKIDKQVKLISNLMTTSLQLKQLLEEVKNLR